jgi:aryl-alcohol dehydrogenase-like predicted oxidoreductase
MSHIAAPPPGGTFPIADRSVARIGFGAMQLTGAGGGTAPDRKRALAVLRRALELGISHLDTAHFYGAGLANELIRAALHPYPDHLVLASKVGAEERPGSGLVPAQRPEELRAAVDANLRGLGVERLDVINLRRLDRPPGIRADGDQLVDLDSQLAELTALRDQGKIGAVGLSNVTMEQLRQALPTGIACVQNAYSVLDRTDEPLLELCREHGLAWVPFFPLGSGFPGATSVTEHPTLVSAAGAAGATAAQVALAWLLGHGPHVLLIPGTSSPGHLAENVAAGELHLAAETVGALDQLAPSRGVSESTA